MASILNSFAALNEEVTSTSGENGGDEVGAEAPDVSSTSDDSLDSEDVKVLEDSCLALYNSGLAAFGRENFQTARDLFQAVLEAKFLTKDLPDTDEVRRKLRFNALKYLGFCHGQQRDFEEAVAKLVEAFNLDSEDVNLSFKLGLYAAKLGRSYLSLARASLQNALQHSPNHLPCLQLLVTTTFQQTDFQACLEFVDMVLRRDPTFIVALQIRKTILKSMPYLSTICPDREHIGDDSNLPLLDMKLVQNESLKGNDMDEEDKHIIEVGDVDFVGFLTLLADDYALLTSKHRMPLSVTLHYKKTKPDPIEVSVQNVVQEMVDIVAGPSVIKAFAEEIVEDMIDSALNRSSKFLILSILHDVIDVVLTTGVASSSKSRPSTGTFLQEVPLDLLEIRRSSRVKGASTDPQVDDNSTNPDMNARAFLESFIPTRLTRQDAAKQENAENRDSSDVSERQTGAQRRIFPTETEQMGTVKSFVETCPSLCLDEIVYKALLLICKVRQCAWPPELKNAYSRLFQAWRENFVLPDEFAPIADLSYVDLLLVAVEIYVEKLQKSKKPSKSDRQAMKEDLFHLRLCSNQLSREDVIRTCLLQHLYCMEQDETENALLFGKQLEGLLDDDDLSPARWSVSDLSISRKAVRSTLSYLEHSKILDKVQEYYDGGQFQKVFDVLSQTIDVQKLRSSEDPDRDETWLMRLFMLIEALWHLGEFRSCLDRCALAMERAVSNADVTDITNLLAMIDACLLLIEAEETLPKDDIQKHTAVSLCQSLITIMAKQISRTLNIRSTKPWLIFYKMISREEEKLGTTDDNGLPNSINFLISAHDYTGQLSMCTDGCGELLMTLIHQLIPMMRYPSLSSSVHESVKRSVDQAMYCLFCHPSKKTKAKYLVDHSVSAIALTWDKCEALYLIVKPSKLPEFDDFKSSSISSDAEALLRRFVALVPDEFDLRKRADRVKAFFSSDDDEFPRFQNNKSFPRGMIDIFFLLGDYYFKNSNFDMSVPYFLQDLSFNSHRVDSYVELALATANNVETKLEGTYSDDVDGILRDSRSVIRMFRECQKNEGSQPTVFIESANFAFVMNAFCSRVLRGETTSLSLEQFASIEKYKHSLLTFADESYVEANKLLEVKLADQPNYVDERWLVHFYRGKIMEKRGKDVGNSLREYLNSMRNLRSQGQSIPKKLLFSVVGSNMSLELLELYYRFHASILKLELQPGFSEDSIKTETIWNLCHELDSLDLFDYNTKKPDTSVESQGEMMLERKEAPSWEVLSERCVKALECVRSTYSHHYKALHMLAAYFMGKHKRRDVQRAKEYIVGGNSSASTKLSTLFGDRKASNLFNGIWRSPVTELERPGSFPTHVAKCVNTLFEMLRETEDHSILLEAVTILKKPVEGEKKYLFERDRQIFYTEACTSLMTILRKKSEKFGRQQELDEAKIRFSLDLYQASKCKKQLPKASLEQLKGMLKSVYVSFSGKIEATVEEVNTFFAKMQAVEKEGGFKEFKTRADCENLVNKCLAVVIPSSVQSCHQPSQASVRGNVTAERAASSAWQNLLLSTDHNQRGPMVNAAPSAFSLLLNSLRHPSSSNQPSPASTSSTNRQSHGVTKGNGKATLGFMQASMKSGGTSEWCSKGAVKRTIDGSAKVKAGEVQDKATPKPVSQSTPKNKVLGGEGAHRANLLKSPTPTSSGLLSKKSVPMASGSLVKKAKISTPISSSPGTRPGGPKPKAKPTKPMTILKKFDGNVPKSLSEKPNNDEVEVICID